MDTKVNRDILYFNKFYNETNNSNKILQIKGCAPRHKKNEWNRECPYLFLQEGSFTIEAAFCATAFFLVFFSLLFIFIMLKDKNHLQMELAKATCKYESYGSKDGTIESLFRDKVLIAWKEKEDLCYVEHMYKIPFLGERFFRVSQYQQIKINNYQGKSMIPSDLEKDVYVYVAQNGEVYHKDRGCIYLNPEIHSTYYEDVSSKRNYSGRKYKMCKYCCHKEDLRKGRFVYIAPYGESYHCKNDCPGLKRTVRKVKLSEIGKLPGCSKCAR